MISPLSSLEIGSLAEWASAVAACISIPLTILALLLAHKANTTAEESRREMRDSSKEALRLEGERERRDLEREQRALAGVLQAWWAQAPDDGKFHQWGVIVSNESAYASVFYDVVIHVEGCLAQGLPLASLQARMKVVPPGRFFIEASNDEHPWMLPLAIDSSQEYRAVTKSENHKIVRIDFTDSLGSRWKWVLGRGLEKEL